MNEIENNLSFRQETVIIIKLLSEFIKNYLTQLKINGTIYAGSFIYNKYKHNYIIGIKWQKKQKIQMMKR